MLQRLMSRRSFLLGIVGVVMSSMLTLWGCGGSGGTSSYSQSVTTTSAPAIIDAATLKKWIDEGKLNAPFGTKDRVVVVSPSTTKDWVLATKGHIPGAVRWDTTEFAMTRVEGLAAATNMMPTGSMMDAIIQRLGIDSNTTIVVSLPKNSTLYYQSLVYWDLRYWGFARNRIKILNAGDDAWEVAGYSLSQDATDKYTASTYSVAQNGTLKDVVRYSIGEMIGTIDSLIATPTLKSTWQIIDVRGFETTPYITNALRMSAYTQFFTRLDAGDGVRRNYLYPDKATLETRFAASAVKDGSTDAFISATKKTVVMCTASSSASPSFVLFDAVLAVPEGNIMMYDGSASQWNLYSSARLTAAYQTTIAAQINAWAFDYSTNPRAVGTVTTVLDESKGVPGPSDYSMFSVAPVFGPTHIEMNQIETADKAYMNSSTSSSTTSSSGSAPSGC